MLLHVMASSCSLTEDVVRPTQDCSFLYASLQRVFDSSLATSWLLERTAQYDYSRSINESNPNPDQLMNQFCSSDELSAAVGFTYSISPSVETKTYSSEQSSDAKTHSSTPHAPQSARMKTLLIPKLKTGSFVLGTLFMREPHVQFSFPEGVSPGFVRRFVVDLDAEQSALVLIVFTRYSNLQSVVEVRRVDRSGVFTGVYLWFDRCEPYEFPSKLIQKVFFTDDPLHLRCDFCTLRNLSDCSCPDTFRKRAATAAECDELKRKSQHSFSDWVSQLITTRKPMTVMNIASFDTSKRPIRSAQVLTSISFLRNNDEELMEMKRVFVQFVFGTYSHLQRNNLSPHTSSSGRVSLKALTVCSQPSETENSIQNNRSSVHFSPAGIGFEDQSGTSQEVNETKDLFALVDKFQALERDLSPVAACEQEQETCGVHEIKTHSEPSTRVNVKKRKNAHGELSSSNSISDDGLRSTQRIKTVQGDSGGDWMAFGEYISYISGSIDNGWLCRTCDFVCNEKNALLEHVFSMHLKSLGSCCPVCKREFSTGSNLRQHIRLVHIDLRLHSCPQCGSSFKLKSKLRRHERNVHSTPTSEHLKDK
uniref:C2H2-type domain-containing protein n=1 Tax=Timspurckia oligopyrenoides TaxID=708627 RepID=A0A7S0ZE89_9RHOD|mmetsp:Transcript_1866/g.3326  ORF Transcript_1866/g.3326 Transcript_1866/m.3326 type:complete len:592 (+) Transcript_1866:99-1874(+)